MKLFKHLSKYPLLVICALVFLILVPNVNWLPVSIMEARNFITTRELLESGEWLLTTMNGLPRYEKPPFPIWVTAICSIIFNSNSLFVLRLPVVVMLIFTGFTTYKFSKAMLFNKIHCLTNALVLITSFYMVSINFEAPSDIYTHAFMLTGIYFLYKLLSSEKTKWMSAILSGICIGLSILSKGPVAIYAMLIPFLIAFGFTYKFKISKLKIAALLLVFLVGFTLGGSWYLYIKLVDTETLNALANREVNTWTNYNIRPFYYYWSFFTQSGLWTMPAFISLLYPYLKTRVKHLKAYKLTLLWTIISVVMLSLIPMKKTRYLVPVLIPLAFNIGFYLDYLFRKFKNIKQKKETLPVYFNFGLIGLVGLLFPILFVFFKVEIQDYLLLFLITAIILVLLGVSIIYYLKTKNIRLVFLCTIVFFVAAITFALPLTKGFKNKDYLSLNNLNTENIKRDIILYSLNKIVPENVWSYGTKIPEIKKDGNKFIFPSEHRFGLLINVITKKEKEEIYLKYNVQEIATYNLNYHGEDSNRLTNIFYILTKK